MIVAFTSSDSLYSQLQMPLGSHNIHGDGRPGLLVRRVKYAQLEALPQHPNQRHVNINVAN